ncbi:MAG: small subunit ribosomal protein S20 [Parcubacteria group bacterium Greene0416_79]|nr:MAG: small subunit ribosomal protein S20 [Parcubacteria group bacterium Greene0416_79]
MAITSSAKKAHRASLRRRVFNMRRKGAISEAVKRIKKLLAEKRPEEARQLIPRAYRAFDKAAKEHTIKKGAADRKKSRLTRLIQNVT